MSDGRRILSLLEDPEALEALYREDSEAFRATLRQALDVDPDAIVLRVWRARLFGPQERPATGWRERLPRTVAIALACAALVRLPGLWLDVDWYYPRMAPTWVVLGLAAYFWYERRNGVEARVGLVLAAVIAAYTAWLPGQGDSVVMALLHIPFVAWAFLGVVFAGVGWRGTDARIRFVRYNGELVVLGSLVGLGGLVFSGVTVGLFAMVFPDIEDLYFENVGLVGAVSVPVVATYLSDAVFGRRTGIPSILARVFAPLFLVMAVAYLAVALLGGENPFLDRSFLVTFNALLLLVLLIAVFSIVERGAESAVGVMDRVNVALVVVTLAIDAIALAAIVFRLASFGPTPNRVIVLGVNLVVMVHLAWMCWTYLRVLRGVTGFAAMQRVVAGYLPVYAAWAALVAFVAPLLFGFA